MIARLRGELVEITAGKLVVDCHGVGYEVLFPQALMSRLPLEGEPVVLHTRMIVREDAQFLVGFLQKQDGRLFDLLTEVKGCGPKIALQVIGDLGSETTLQSIAAEDARTLSKATGVGPKLAERIILELKEKVRTEKWIHAAEAIVRPVVQGIEDELVDALVQLGYRRPEAELAANSVDDPDASLEDRLKSALRSLSKK